MVEATDAEVNLPEVVAEATGTDRCREAALVAANLPNTDIGENSYGHG